MKTLTNCGDFTGAGSSIRISNSGNTPKRIGNLNSAFKKADSQSSTCDFEKKSRNPASKILEFFTVISGLENNLQNHRRLLKCRNKHFEKGFRSSKLVSVFIEASKNLNFHLSITRHKKFQKDWSIDIKYWHLVTQSLNTWLVSCILKSFLASYCSAGLRTFFQGTNPLASHWLEDFFKLYAREKWPTEGLQYSKNV